MNKILIAVFVIILAYLGYNTLSNNSTELESATVENVDKKPQSSQGVEVSEAHASLETGVDISDYDFTGRYFQERITDTFTAELIVEIVDGENYRHIRNITKDGQTKSGQVIGKYEVLNDSVLHLYYPEERNKQVFPTPKALFEVKTNGTLVSGDWVLTRE